MQELNHDLQGAMFGRLENETKFECIEKALRETAKKWAGYCCDEFEDDLLDKGLKVSKAIVEFLNEMEREDLDIEQGIKTP